MRAAVMHAYAPELLRVEEVPDPAPARDGAVVEVRASGVCRSDWHGWMGHDPDISLPHVPGHELAGVIAHELAHIKNRDTLVMSIAATIGGSLSMLAELTFWSMLFGGSEGEEGEAAGGLAGIILAPVAALLVQMALAIQVRLRSLADWGHGLYVVIFL